VGESWRRREATGDMIIVRYADDFIVGFQHEGDARRFLDELRNRLEEFALSLHPEKTRLIEFGALRRQTANAVGRQAGEPSTSWASRSSAASRGGQVPDPTQRPDAIECRASSGRSSRHCGGACIKTSHAGEMAGAGVRGYFNYHAVRPIGMHW